jgi:hypothetical protein
MLSVAGSSLPPWRPRDLGDSPFDPGYGRAGFRRVFRVLDHGHDQLDRTIPGSIEHAVAAGRAKDPRVPVPDVGHHRVTSARIDDASVVVQDRGSRHTRHREALGRDQRGGGIRPRYVDQLHVELRVRRQGDALAVGDGHFKLGVLGHGGGRRECRGKDRDDQQDYGDSQLQSPLVSLAADVVGDARRVHPGICGASQARRAAFASGSRHGVAGFAPGYG